MYLISGYETQTSNIMCRPTWHLWHINHVRWWQSAPSLGEVYSCMLLRTVTYFWRHWGTNWGIATFFPCRLPEKANKRLDNCSSKLTVGEILTSIWIFLLNAPHFGMQHQFQMQKWRPLFLASQSHSKMVNIFIKPIDTPYILIVFSPFLPSAVSIFSTSHVCVMPRQFEATVTMLLSFHFTIKTSLCALKDIVLGLSFFSDAVFCKRHFWRWFSRILPVPPIPFSLSLLRRGKLVKKLLK